MITLSGTYATGLVKLTDKGAEICILWAQCSYYFSVFSPTDSFEIMVASHVTEPGSLLTELGAVIKFSHFSIHPSTCML